MLSYQMQSNIFKKIIKRAIKIPILYLFVSGIFLTLSFGDDIFHIPSSYQIIFSLLEKFADIFFILAILTFIYNSATLLLKHFEHILFNDHLVAALIMRSLRKSLRILYLLIVINCLISWISPNREHLIFLNKIMTAIIIASIGWIVIQILYAVETVFYQRMKDLRAAEQLRHQAFYTKLKILRNIFTTLVIIITIAAILMSFNSVRNIGISVLASAGFITAIIGLSAQKTLFSIFSSLQIFLSQVIKIGDVVAIEKDTGIIDEITFTYVALKLSDKKRLIVPINYFIEKAFINRTQSGFALEDSFYLHVDFAMPIEALRHEVKRLVGQSSVWDGKVCELTVAQFYEHNIQLRMQLSAENPEALNQLQIEIKEKLLQFIQNNYLNFMPKTV